MAHKSSMCKKWNTAFFEDELPGRNLTDPGLDKSGKPRLPLGNMSDLRRIWMQEKALQESMLGVNVEDEIEAVHRALDLYYNVWTKVCDRK